MMFFNPCRPARIEPGSASWNAVCISWPASLRVECALAVLVFGRRLFGPGDVTVSLVKSSGTAPDGAMHAAAAKRDAALW